MMLAETKMAIISKTELCFIFFSWAMPESSPNAQPRRWRGPGRQNLACKLQAQNDKGTHYDS